eukprot:TRINITY_DN16573_c0_g1_i1.p1 TRINITY_DN16573_c0_g1~~TRINITY_DN16573_c0_g1_i1.p1  ORF type:complete len:103 (-),score=29.07 TRINITY_DN16573_c0_g1_i1:72-380(-)
MVLSTLLTTRLTLSPIITSLTNKVSPFTCLSRSPFPIHKHVRTVTTRNGIIRPIPAHYASNGVLKVILATTMGLYLGAAISWTMAAWLEENDLFTVEGEDED